LWPGKETRQEKENFGVKKEGRFNEKSRDTAIVSNIVGYGGAQDIGEKEPGSNERVSLNEKTKFDHEKIGPKKKE